MIDNRLNDMLRDFDYRLQSQGMKLDQYMKMTGSTVDSFKAQFKDQAQEQVKMNLTLEAIAKAENRKLFEALMHDLNIPEPEGKTVFNLEDGFIQADALSYIDEDKSQVGIEIHSGRNRIVRRIFEHFGYKIKKLDRVYFAGLTKKNLRRGQWRFLTDIEVSMLKILPIKFQEYARISPLCLQATSTTMKAEICTAECLRQVC